MPPEASGRPTAAPRSQIEKRKAPTPDPVPSLNLLARAYRLPAIERVEERLEARRRHFTLQNTAEQRLISASDAYATVRCYTPRDKPTLRVAGSARRGHSDLATGSSRLPYSLLRRRDGPLSIACSARYAAESHPNHLLMAQHGSLK